MEINLKNNSGYKWFSNGNIYVKGYLYDTNNKLYADQQLIDYFLIDKCSFEDKLKGANGIFAVVIKEENCIKFAVDRIRTIPLFYKKKQGKYYLFDRNIIDSDSELDLFSAEEFSSSGFVTGKNTLIKDIFQLQAGEWGKISEGELQLKSYSSYIIKDHALSRPIEDDLSLIFDSLIKRTIKYANGKKLVAPLSGGYDSRLLVTLLRKHNYDNVLCFTYGRANSFEVKTSRKVAETLKYDWIFVEYNDELIKGFSSNETFRSYFFDLGSNLTSLAHIQDFFAIQDLMKKGVLTSDSIFLPGHSGDFLAGSHLNRKWRLTSNENFLLKSIFETHYSLNNYTKSYEKLKNKVLSNSEKGIMYSVFENWDLKERQAKFIVNSVRVYDLFNFKYLLPLWDNEMITFFKYLPLKEKINTVFFNNVVEHKIFREYNVDFKKQEPTSFSTMIKKILPPFIKQFLKGVLSKKVDINNFDTINEELGEPKGKHINSVLVEYYLKKIKNDLN